MLSLRLSRAVLSALSSAMLAALAAALLPLAGALFPLAAALFPDLAILTVQNPESPKKEINWRPEDSPKVKSVKEQIYERPAISRRNPWTEGFDEVWKPRRFSLFKNR